MLATSQRANNLRTRARGGAGTSRDIGLRYARMLAPGHRRHARPPKSSGARPVLVVVQSMDVRYLDLPRMWYLQRLHGS